MTVPNPYLSSDTFVGRTEELEEIHKNLMCAKSVQVIGGRRCGKTELVKRLIPMDRRPYYIDAGAWSLHSEEDALLRIGQALEIPEPHSVRNSLEEALLTRDPVLLVFDEIDRILSCSWASSFLAWLRFLDGRNGRVKFVLVGGPVLSSYMDPELGSPAINAAEVVYLAPLNHAARRDLASRYPIRPKVLRDVLHAAAGHPWLLTRLLRWLWEGKTFSQAYDNVFDSGLGHFKVWKRQLGAKGIKLVRSLPPDGISFSEFKGSGQWNTYREIRPLVRSMCLIDFDATGRRMIPGPKLFLDWLNQNSAGPELWDLGISYASEEEGFAREIKAELAEYKVFFAPDELAYMWGQNLRDTLPNIFGQKCRYVLALCSHAYISKEWTIREFNAAREKLEGRLLVVNLGVLPLGIPEDFVYAPATPRILVTLISKLKKILSP